jgi:hypothetical protein
MTAVSSQSTGSACASYSNPTMRTRPAFSGPAAAGPQDAVDPGAREAAHPRPVPGVQVTDRDGHAEVTGDHLDALHRQH